MFLKLSQLLFIFLIFGLSSTAFAEEYVYQTFQINKQLLGEKYPDIDLGKRRLRNGKGLKFKPSSSSTFGAESPLMKQVRSYLQSDYKNIEEEQLEALYTRKKSFNLGVKNYNGFVWQKPIGNAHIIADRQIEPNQQKGPKYIVSDVLILKVDAQTYLKGLAGEGIITAIEDAEFGAFAGLEFRRVYTYKHFSNDYNMAIEENMQKLFLSFLFFETANIDFVGTGEVLSKEDYIGFYAGAMIDIPLQYNFSLSAGALIKADKTSKMTATIPVEDDMLSSNEFLRINYEKSTSFTAGAELKLKLDFFNFLKISLLKFEYSETRTSSEELHLSFQIEDYYKLMSSNPVNRSLVKLMRFTGYDSNVLDPYVQTYSLNRKLNKLWNFRFLKEGKASRTQSEQIITQRKKEKKRFLGHDYSHLEFEQGWKDAMISMAVQSLINTDLFSKYMKTHKKITDLDFESEDEENFSLKVTHEFMVAKTHTGKYEKYKEDIINFSYNFSNLPQDILYLIDHKKIVGPMKVKAVSEFGQSGFTFFKSFSKEKRKEVYTEICKPHKKRNRRPNNRGPRYSNPCQTTMTSLMAKFDSKSKNDADQLWVFKDVVDKVNYYSTSINDLTSMFGPQLTLNTVIEAYTDSGMKFKHYSTGARNTKPTALEAYLDNRLTQLPKLYFH